MVSAARQSPTAIAPDLASSRDTQFNDFHTHAGDRRADVVAALRHDPPMHGNLDLAQELRLDKADAFTPGAYRSPLPPDQALPYDRVPQLLRLYLSGMTGTPLRERADAMPIEDLRQTLAQTPPEQVRFRNSLSSYIDERMEQGRDKAMEICRKWFDLYKNQDFDRIGMDAQFMAPAEFKLVRETAEKMAANSPDRKFQTFARLLNTAKLPAGIG